MMLLNLITVVLWGILYVLLFVIALALILSLAPFKGDVLVKNNHVTLHATYLFGVLKASYVSKRWEFRFFGFRPSRNIAKEENGQARTPKVKKSEDVSDGKKPKKHRKRGMPSRHVIALTLNLLKRLIRKIAPHKCRLCVYLGLDDPHDSGLVSMVTSMLFIPLNTVNGYNLQCVPLYDDLDLRVNAEVAFKCSVADLAIPCVGFILKKPIRQYVWPKKEKKLKKDVVA